MVGVASLALLVGCTGGSGQDPSGADAPATASAASSSRPRSSEPTDTAPSSQTSAGTATTTAPEPSKPVTIAFAGDVHFSGSLASRLAHPSTAMGPLGRELARADLAMVNLETAVTTRGYPQPKEYRFRAPPVAFDALSAGGIDVVTMANNHGLDYGPVSVPDALTAARERGMPVVGIGRDARQAFRPWIASVHGQRIAFIGATAVVDASLVASWSAGPHQAGVATALDGDNARLVAAIKKVRPHVDTVVVDMHYGSDLMQCPTDIQRGVVRDAVRAGADVVVGQHAHALLGAGYRGTAYVSYGLGNFEFYSAGGLSAQTGVLTLTVDGREVTRPTWTPGTISGGLPIPLNGTAAAEAVDRWRSLRGCAGLSADPSSR
jgi:poly-gamma-glutamate capsule biosynthesis protein CapA/YwtB (metallophosphatase superfamily)